MSLYSQLFLRETGSPYGDITRNSTLSFKDLDQNFIFLKERDINQLKIVGSNLIYETLGGTEYSVNIGGASSNNTFVTGFTFNNPSTYKLTIEQNQGESPLTVDLSSLASDVYVLSGSYNSTTGDVEFINSTGGSFTVTGFTTGMTDSYTDGATLNGNTIQFSNNIEGDNFYSVDLSSLNSGFIETTLFNTYTGATQTQLNNKVESASNVGGASQVFSVKSGTDLQFRTISGGTNTTITTVGNIIKVDSTASADNYYVTGGTLNDGTLTLERNDDDSFDITGFTDGCSSIVTNVGSGNSELYSLPLSANTGAFFDYVVSGDTGVRSGSLTTVFSGGVANIADLSTADIGDTSGVSFNVTLDSIKAKLNVSAVTGTWRIELTPSKCDITSTTNGGEITTAINVGSGEGLFSGKSGVELQFKSLESTGGTVTITSTGDTINLESSGGGGGSGLNYISAGDVATNLENTSNWDINGVYTGSTTATGTQADCHVDSNYWFTCVATDEWIRLIRG